MWVRVLGSAAGGGFPQWNCTCPPCRAVRDGSRPARPRSQSSVAVSADRKQWFLLNASPDVQTQIEDFPALHPGRGLGGEQTLPGGERQVPLRAVLLTDAELDHTLGLLLLREGRGLDVHATEAVHGVLCHGTGLLRVLGAYCPVRWHPVDPGACGEMPLGGGLSYRAFDVPTAKRARFGPQDAAGRVVGYRLSQDGGGTLVFLPCLPELTGPIRAELDGCAALLVDGTCWQDDELIRLGLAGKTARDMGHLPISGSGGSLAELASLPIGRTIYTHINNTNPILLEDSAERRTLADHGIEVAADGLELQI
jgi:pyrroloquinoline quinone biosynthesis protein B